MFVYASDGGDINVDCGSLGSFNLLKIEFEMMAIIGNQKSI